MKLKEVLEIEPLSKALQCTLTLAQEQGANELAKWLQLEIGGYYASNSHSVIAVPEYRAVAGAHLNIYGQRLKAQPGSSSISEMRLREGVEALESLRDSRQTIVQQVPTVAGWIAQPDEAATFHFEPVELVQVLSQIRSELSRRVQVLADSAFEGGSCGA
jgi:hypothetical protein